MICDVFGKEREVRLLGWVYDTRDLKKVRFLVLKDISGRIQVTAPVEKVEREVFELIDKVKRESVVEVIGKSIKSKQAPGGWEVIPKFIKVIAKAEDPLPIDVSDYSKTELPIRLNNRFLDLHRGKIQAIFKVQSTILRAFREFMFSEGAIEVILPSIISSSSEGGTELFKVKYFEKDAFLSQSCQLYKQMLACSMEKVFTVFVAWRAEKHNTTRHLNESRQFDYEEAFADDKKVMDVLARCVVFIVKKVLEENKEEVKLLNPSLKVPKVKYVSFTELRSLLREKGISVPLHDLGTGAEHETSKIFKDTLLMVHSWPIEGKPFYIMPDGKLSKGFDALLNGLEICSGGQRIHRPELLEERLKANNLNPEDFKDYINSFRFGAPPHAGWAVGVERLTMVLLGLDNIREATLFPRDRDRLNP